MRIIMFFQQSKGVELCVSNIGNAYR